MFFVHSASSPTCCVLALRSSVFGFVSCKLVDLLFHVSCVSRLVCLEGTFVLMHLFFYLLARVEFRVVWFGLFSLFRLLPAFVGLVLFSRFCLLFCFPSCFSLFVLILEMLQLIAIDIQTLNFVRFL